MFVLFVAIAIWGIGHVLDQPKRRRVTLIALLLAVVLLTHALFPSNHPLPRLFGGNFAAWATLVGGIALVAIYREGLKRLRNHAAPQEVKKEGSFSEAELGRYARHIVLREIGGPGQKALKDARVLVVGAGGLGSPALLYLAASGVGTVGVIDGDIVDNSNLQRQVIHRDEDIGTPKVFSAERAMKAQNPYVVVRPYNRRLTEDIAADLFAEYDLVLEGCDNFETRYLVNRIAASLRIPVIGGALTQWEGQISIWHPASGAPCYQCVFPEAPDPGLAPSCSEAGVAGPLPGVVGSMMAVEAIKYLTEAGETLAGRLLIYDALYADSRIVRVKPRPDCPVCGARLDKPGPALSSSLKEI
ncbi:HesA/MoeB/ThiF family protein [Maritimibacter dapengensis]|uniref:Molybdopterin-synthase adenylyltransferase MoeB n=1 Tax=Maritimibacter dapengensis TaxID=2836868 RepID=A0ABS6T7Y3_9RHOB|nr:molybdopterin-synthase adenylyltransferase MoeB [Maritimibacter dapengensis]MBV7380666.1 molybdopterin-synthase adenylyltransferase MoeB [Maritimibacter dapengensis]